MSAYSLDLREKIVESVKKGIPKASDRTALRGRSCHRKTLLQKARGGRHLRAQEDPRQRAPKLDEKATKLLVEDLQRRPWATHSQRAEFLFAVCGVRVSEATVCRTLQRLSHSRKKDPKGL